MSELSHLDEEGRARMIDVGAKAVTRRVATASGRLDTTSEVIALVRADGLPKADVLATARIAGIQGAKRTSELIPLAHLLPLEKVQVEFELGDSAITIRATVAVTAKTGVEMEALTAVAVAGLTLHDMIKSVDPAAVLGDIRLLEKSGGKHGHWTPAVELVETPHSSVEPAETPPSSVEPVETPPSSVEPVETPPSSVEPVETPASSVEPVETPPSSVEPVETPASSVEPVETPPSTPPPVSTSSTPASTAAPATVIVSSTGVAAGTRTDTTGPAIVAWLRERGYDVAEPVVVADADIAQAVADAVAASPAVVLTTGGTGIHPQDRTPEATRAVLDRELPGVAEALRAAGRAATPTSDLSRAVAGVAGSTIVVNLPGSSGGVRDGLAVLDPLLPHLRAQLAGGGHG